MLNLLAVYTRPGLGRLSAPENPRWKEGYTRAVRGLVMGISGFA